MKTIPIAAAVTAIASLISLPRPRRKTRPSSRPTRTLRRPSASSPATSRPTRQSAVAGAWAMTKGLLFDESNTLEPKVKSLINLAVAAQIPCQYCIWLETKTAKVAGRDR